MQDNEDPYMVELKEFEIWVQIYDIPQGCVSESIVKNVGMLLGRYIKSDPSNFDRVWKPSMRVRVAMNVEKPLKKKNAAQKRR